MMPQNAGGMGGMDPSAMMMGMMPGPPMGMMGMGMPPMQGMGPVGGAMNPLGGYNNLYKTSLCKHFMQTKHCHVGAKCHFAHGEHELRKADDALPIEQTMKMMNIPYNNYKTQTCKYFELSGGNCKFGKNCSFAHGGFELRNPYDAVPLNANPAVTGQPGFGQGDMYGPGTSGTTADGSLDAQNPTPFKQSDVKIIMSDPTSSQIKLHILQASTHFQSGNKDEGLKIINQLLMSGDISIEYPQSYNKQAKQQIHQFNTQGSDDMQLHHQAMGNNYSQMNTQASSQGGHQQQNMMMQF